MTEQWAAVWRAFDMFSAIFLRSVVIGWTSSSRAPAAAYAGTGIAFKGRGAAGAGAAPGAAA